MSTTSLSLSPLCEALAALHSPQSTPEMRRGGQGVLSQWTEGFLRGEGVLQRVEEVMSVLESVSMSPAESLHESIQSALNILGRHGLPLSLLQQFLLSAIESALQHSPPSPSPSLSLSLPQTVWRRLAPLSLSPRFLSLSPRFLLEKVAAIIVEIGIREYPQQWPEFSNECCGGTSLPWIISSRVIKGVSEVLLVETDSLPVRRRQELSRAWTAACNRDLYGVIVQNLCTDPQEHTLQAFSAMLPFLDSSVTLSSPQLLECMRTTCIRSWPKETLVVIETWCEEKWKSDAEMKGSLEMVLQILYELVENILGGERLYTAEEEICEVVLHVARILHQLAFSHWSSLSLISLSHRNVYISLSIRLGEHKALRIAAEIAPVWSAYILKEWGDVENMKETVPQRLLPAFIIAMTRSVQDPNAPYGDGDSPSEYQFLPDVSLCHARTYSEWQFADGDEYRMEFSAVRPRVMDAVAKICELYPEATLQTLFSQVEETLKLRNVDENDHRNETYPCWGSMYSYKYLIWERTTEFMDLCIRQLRRTPLNHAAESLMIQLLGALTEPLSEWDTVDPLVKGRHLHCLGNLSLSLQTEDRLPVLSALLNSLLGTCSWNSEPQNVDPNMIQAMNLSEDVLAVRKKSAKVFVHVCRECAGALLGHLESVLTVVLGARVTTAGDAILLREGLVGVATQLPDPRAFVEVLTNGPRSLFQTVVAGMGLGPEVRTGGPGAEEGRRVAEVLLDMERDWETLDQVPSLLALLVRVVKEFPNRPETYEGWLPMVMTLVKSLHSLLSLSLQSPYIRILAIDTEEKKDILGLARTGRLSVVLRQKWLEACQPSTPLEVKRETRERLARYWLRRVRDYCYQIIGDLPLQFASPFLQPILHTFGEMDWNQFRLLFRWCLGPTLTRMSNSPTDIETFRCRVFPTLMIQVNRRLIRGWAEVQARASTNPTTGEIDTESPEILNDRLVALATGEVYEWISNQSSQGNNGAISKVYGFYEGCNSAVLHPATEVLLETLYNGLIFPDISARNKSVRVLIDWMPKICGVLEEASRSPSHAPQVTAMANWIGGDLMRRMMGVLLEHLDEWTTNVQLVWTIFDYTVLQHRLSTSSLQLFSELPTSTPDLLSALPTSLSLSLSLSARSRAFRSFLSTLTGVDPQRPVQSRRRGCVVDLPQEFLSRVRPAGSGPVVRGTEEEEVVGLGELFGP